MPEQGIFKFRPQDSKAECTSQQKAEIGCALAFGRALGLSRDGNNLAVAPDDDGNAELSIFCVNFLRGTAERTHCRLRVVG
jgi:hypothetical protein